MSFSQFSTLGGMLPKFVICHSVGFWPDLLRGIPVKIGENHVFFAVSHIRGNAAQIRNFSFCGTFARIYEVLQKPFCPQSVNILVAKSNLGRIWEFRVSRLSVPIKGGTLPKFAIFHSVGIWPDLPIFAKTILPPAREYICSENPIWAGLGNFA